MKPVVYYWVGFIGSIAWLSHWADTPKAMAVSAIVACCCFVMLIAEGLSERVNELSKSVGRLWKEVSPPMYQDSDL